MVYTRRGQKSTPLGRGVNIGSMKIFLIGGVSVENSDPLYKKQKADLEVSMAELGRAIARAGHDLLVCSPFEDSADVSAAVSALKAIEDSTFESAVEFHHPDAAAVVAEMRVFMGRFPVVELLKSFQHPTPRDEHGNDVLEYAWLLSQTYAMDRSHGVIALGGKVGRCPQRRP